MDERIKIQELLKKEKDIQEKLSKLAKKLYNKEKGKIPTQGYRRALRELGFVA